MSKQFGPKFDNIFKCPVDPVSGIVNCVSYFIEDTVEEVTDRPTSVRDRHLHHCCKLMSTLTIENFIPLLKWEQHVPFGREHKGLTSGLAVDHFLVIATRGIVKQGNLVFINWSIRTLSKGVKAPSTQLTVSTNMVQNPVNTTSDPID